MHMSAMIHQRKPMIVFKARLRPERCVRGSTVEIECANSNIYFRFVSVIVSLDFQ